MLARKALCRSRQSPESPHTLSRTQHTQLKIRVAQLEETLEHESPTHTAAIGDTSNVSMTAEQRRTAYFFVLVFVCALYFGITCLEQIVDVTQFFWQQRIANKYTTGWMENGMPCRNCTQRWICMGGCVGWVVGWVGGVCECVGGCWCVRCVYMFEYISPGMVLWMDGRSSFESNYWHFVSMHICTVKRRILFVHTFSHTLTHVRAHTHKRANRWLQ